MQMATGSIRGVDIY